MKRDPIVSFQNFFFRYSEKDPLALSDINLQIFPGQIILLGGSSGSGKSTLCNAISGRIPFDISGQMKGTVTILGKSVWEHIPEELPKKIAYLFQNPEEQLVTFTVFDEIAFALENYLESSEMIKKRVLDIATKLEITKLLSKSIYALSGGEKQKVVLAANLVLEPEILILDEPLAFLDEKGEKALIGFLRNVHQTKPNLTIIIIEHRLDPFKNLIDDIIILSENGSILFNGTQTEYIQFAASKNVQYIREDNKLNHQISHQYPKKENNQSKPDDESNFHNSSPLISLEHIYFAYKNSERAVYSDFSLSIKSNEFLGIVGSNGSGKTTLLYLLADIIKPAAGKLFLKGKNYDEIDRDEFFPQIGFIFQNPESQIFETTVSKEILYGIDNFRRFGKQAEFFCRFEDKGILEKMAPLIYESRISEEKFLDQNPFCLSWGQKRRLNLASIFSYEPEILLIDEPFIGQDALAVKKIFEILVNFHKAGKTIIIVSHDRELLKSYCTRIINIEEAMGKVQQVTEQQTQKIALLPDKAIPSEIKPKQARPASSENLDNYGKKSKRMARLQSLLQMQEASQNTGWLFKINAVAKLCAVLVLTAAFFTQKSIILLFITLVLFLILAKSSNIAPSSILHQIRIVIMFTVIYIPINAIYDASTPLDSEVLFYLLSGQRLPVRRIALYFAIRTGLLILNLLASAIIFIRTTNLKDLTYGLIQIKIPYRIAFAFMIGLRYVPLIAVESNTIEIAQTLRGVKLKKGVSVKNMYYFIVQRLTTLLISILRKSKTTSSAIEARGFGYDKQRTNLHQITWKINDILYIAVIGTIAALLILVSAGIISIGFLPSLYSVYSTYLQSFFCQIFWC